MPDINANDINKLIEEAEDVLREGAYVTVGLGVLAFQRAQVRRRELAKRLDQERANLSSQLPNGFDGISSQLSELASQLSGGGDRLTGQFGDVGKSFSSNVDTARSQFRDLVKTVDEWVGPARRQLDQQVDSFEGYLPASARNVVSSVRSAVHGPETRLRSAVGLDTNPPAAAPSS